MIKIKWHMEKTEDTHVGINGDYYGNCPKKWKGKYEIDFIIEWDQKEEEDEAIKIWYEKICPILTENPIPGSGGQYGSVDYIQQYYCCKREKGIANRVYGKARALEKLGYPVIRE